MGVDAMFTVPLMQLSVSDWATKKEKLLQLPDFSASGSADELEGQYFSDYHKHYNHPCPYATEFAASVDDQLREFTDTVGGAFDMQGLWCQRYTGGQFMPPHNHGGLGFSAVLYVEFDPAVHAATHFMAPFNNFLTGECLFYTPEVSEGDIIFFPSALMHYSQPTGSTIPRTIFSFNMVPN